jgi:hypothetical protein
MFSDLYISSSGKKIPLNLNETPHRCNGWLVQNRKYRLCVKGCEAMIYFDEKQKSKNNKWVPIDRRTGLPHQCDN